MTRPPNDVVLRLIISLDTMAYATRRSSEAISSFSPVNASLSIACDLLVPLVYRLSERRHTYVARILPI